MDPELGMSVVRLGLIYDVRVEQDTVEIDMTLTTRGCPLERAITDGVHRVVAELPWVRAVVVRVVWDPAWHPDMIRR
jgi:metal-sulfur cluster biosynthetic enzyme